MSKVDKKEKEKETEKGSQKTPRSKKDKKGKGNEDNQAEDRRPFEDSVLDLPSSPPNKVTISAKSCPVTAVTIYNDRAEVTRQLTLTTHAGLNEVTVEGLPSKVDRNSVRVSGGKGEAVILEVQFNSRWERKNKDEQTELGRCQREKDEIEDKINRCNEAMDRLMKEELWLETWSSSISNPKKKKGEADVVPFFSPRVMEQTVNFLEFYQKQLAVLDSRRAEILKTLKELRADQQKANLALTALNSSALEEVHEVIVLMNAHKDTDVELMLSYVVMEASWHAQYDVRVKSNDDNLELTYYGVIVNNSLDDWHETSLLLSTAQPSIGGAPPDLTTKYIGFQSYPSHSLSMKVMSQQAVFKADEKKDKKKAISEHEDAAPEPLQVMTTGVQESSICTTFSIPRRTTILSDGKPHKVTIRMVPLKADFTYVIMPKLSTHAYLKASIENTSEYPFLVGDINVFMDGNFVCKSNIKAVSPKESIGLFLGTDDALKVTYPPGSFFNDKQGILRRGNSKTVKYQLTVKNTKSKDVQLTIFDQLPKPNDSQIKVKLLKPTIVEGQSDLILTEANNLKWTKDLAAGKSLQITFEYQIDWPLGQELTGY